MRMRYLWGAAAAVCAALPAMAEEVTDFRLDNGLEVVVIADHRAPAVTQMIWYRVGSADEMPGKSGIAHFLEHLMFKGTPTVGPNVFSQRVEAVGGSDNAFTSTDYTAYYQRVSADHLGEVMQMEADRMRNLVLSESDVTTERQVILEERAQRIDSDPSALFTEQRMAAQYMNNHYGIPIIGWRQEMEQLTREDALDWYRHYYAPNDAVLVVAGDVTPDKVRELAEKYYGPLKPSEGITARARAQEPPQRAERRLVMSDARVAQPYLVRSYLAPERNAGDQKDAAALTILAALLGGDGQTSVLGRKLVFGNHKALYTSASYDGLSLDTTTFGLVVMPAAGTSLQEAEDAMDTALAEFRKEGVDAAQLARVKTQIGAAQIYARDNVGTLAQRYGAALTSGLTVQDVKDWPTVLQSVSAEDVMAAFDKVLDRRQAVTGWLTRPEGAPAPADGPIEAPATEAIQ